MSKVTYTEVDIHIFKGRLNSAILACVTNLQSFYPQTLNPQPVNHEPGDPKTFRTTAFPGWWVFGQGVRVGITFVARWTSF